MVGFVGLLCRRFGMLVLDGNSLEFVLCALTLEYMFGVRCLNATVLIVLSTCLPRYYIAAYLVVVLTFWCRSFLPLHGVCPIRTNKTSEDVSLVGKIFSVSVCLMFSFHRTE